MKELSHTSEVAAAMRKRATRARVQSWLALVIVLALVSSCVAILLFVEAVVGRERESSFDRIQNALDEVAVQAAEINDRLDEEIKKDPKNVSEWVKLTDWRIGRILRGLSEMHPTDTQSKFFISIMATRFGTVLILLFLANVFVSIFRYNTRLASFYDSRADALTMCTGQDAVGFTSVLEAVSSEKMDFRTPKSPDAQTLELAKAIVQLQVGRGKQA